MSVAELFNAGFTAVDLLLIRLSTALQFRGQSVKQLPASLHAFLMRQGDSPIYYILVIETLLSSLMALRFFYFSSKCSLPETFVFVNKFWK
jgi:hypothetical protein